jgi:predicted 2-oxoglutarate/Fe(II)-dependent dioxygenase YbiX
MNGAVFPFRPGDRVPDLALPTADGQMRKLVWLFQGRPLVLVALADERACNEDAARILADAANAGATPVAIVGATPAAATGLRIANTVGHPALLCDADRRFLRMLLAPDAPGGAAQDRRVMVLDANQRLVAQSAAASADAAIGVARAAIDAAHRDQPCEQVMFGSAAPVMMMPRVFEPSFCRLLIDRWSSGERADGGVASRYGNVMAADRKRTEDHIVTDPALAKQISDRLAFRIGPELAKAFAWDVQFGFDAHVIISYDAAGRHYFRAHRDNGTPQTADRTFAVSLNLNEDYEGGELVFPEYGPTRYKPKAGAAAVFSCSLLHEALPVTHGRRFVLTTFFRNRNAQPQLHRTP